MGLGLFALIPVFVKKMFSNKFKSSQLEDIKNK